MGSEMCIRDSYFMVRFDLDADREKAVSGGSWMIFDHYLAIHPWIIDLVAAVRP